MRLLPSPRLRGEGGSRRRRRKGEGESGKAPIPRLPLSLPGCAGRSLPPLAGGGLGLILLLVAPAFAVPIVSPRPDAVSVTIYRDPARGGGGAFDLDRLGGFALVSERRTVRLPAGESVIRFEGVAGGIVPVSAIVTGLPGGVVQKNRDARLLSPAALVEGAYGRRLTLRRTDPATGAVTREPVTLLGGPVGGVVIRTEKGIETLRCSGLPETLLHDGVPEGLAPVPTLSVTTRSPAAATATVTLSYLAQGFDWSANYVARMRPGGASLDLAAWATLANANGESFAGADAQLVAGTLSRVETRNLEQGAPDPVLQIGCWPADTTHDGDEGALPPPPPPPPAPPMMMLESADIVVTAQRMMAMAPTPVMAVREELGDLKLYRVPERVTVAAREQKQVALLEQANVPVERVYRFDWPPGRTEPQPATIVLRTRNVVAKRLGLPLPSGSVAVIEPGPDRPLLAGEARLRDVAVGEEVELEVGASHQVQATGARDADGTMRVTVSNANPVPVSVELVFAVGGGDSIAAPSVALGRKDGRPMWAVRVPANGVATLRFGANRVR